VTCRTSTWLQIGGGGIHSDSNVNVQRTGSGSGTTQTHVQRDAGGLASAGGRVTGSQIRDHDRIFIFV
jgi:hypothetical protein